MLTHVRIENQSLLINGYPIGKYSDLCPLSENAEKAMPEDWPLVSALLKVASSYDAFEYDLFLESDLPRQQAINALLLASRPLS